jgi:ribosome-binding factor A
MCGEIARTLGMVLGWESGDPLLRELIVEAVEPAPDSTRVLITVSLPCESRFGYGEILNRLLRATGRLRTEIAAAIHRKRVPELTFRVVGRGEVRS